MAARALCASTTNGCLTLLLQRSLPAASANFAASQGWRLRRSRNAGPQQRVCPAQVLPRTSPLPRKRLMCSHFDVRASDLSALWNMKSFARHRLLQEPVALLDDAAAGIPMSKL